MTWRVSAQTGQRFAVLEQEWERGRVGGKRQSYRERENFHLMEHYPKGARPKLGASSEVSHVSGRAPSTGSQTELAWGRCSVTMPFAGPVARDKMEPSQHPGLRALPCSIPPAV